jgi:hypothetical protein
MLHCDWTSGRLSKWAVEQADGWTSRRLKPRLWAFGHEVRLRGLADHCYCTLL